MLAFPISSADVPATPDICMDLMLLVEHLFPLSRPRGGGHPSRQGNKRRENRKEKGPSYFLSALAHAHEAASTKERALHSEEISDHPRPSNVSPIRVVWFSTNLRILRTRRPTCAFATLRKLLSEKSIPRSENNKDCLSNSACTLIEMNSVLPDILFPHLECPVFFEPQI